VAGLNLTIGVPPAMEIFSPSGLIADLVCDFLYEIAYSPTSARHDG